MSSKLKKLSRNIQKKIEKIKLVITDVDGVLTDGGMYYSKNGEELKKFHTRDGMGVELLSQVGIGTIFMTKEKSLIAKKRAKKVRALDCFVGIKNKENMLEHICKKFDLHKNEIAYIGDDINDAEIIRQVGFSASPNDAMEEIRKSVDYISQLNGGNGVLRDIAEFILKYKK